MLSQTLSPIGAGLRRIAIRELRNEIGAEPAKSAVDCAFYEHRRARARLAREPSIGGRLMLDAAALTVCLFRALLARDIPEQRARTLTAKVTAAVYDLMARVPSAIARVGGGAPVERLRRATSAFRRFPFGPPAYRMLDVAAGEDTVAFDVVRCPVAEYFRAQDLPELCVASFCNLDYPLAARWGATLERTKTLVEGAECCDFRWRVSPRDAEKETRIE
jgi:hypothetical protein